MVIVAPLECTMLFVNVGDPVPECAHQSPL